MALDSLDFPQARAILICPDWTYGGKIRAEYILAIKVAYIFEERTEVEKTYTVRIN